MHHKERVVELRQTQRMRQPEASSSPVVGWVERCLPLTSVLGHLSLMSLLCDYPKKITKKGKLSIDSCLYIYALRIDTFTYVM